MTDHTAEVAVLPPGTVFAEVRTVGGGDACADMLFRVVHAVTQCEPDGSDLHTGFQRYRGDDERFHCINIDGQNRHWRQGVIAIIETDDGEVYGFSPDWWNSNVVEPGKARWAGR